MKINTETAYISVRTKLVAAFMITIIPIVFLGAISSMKSANAIKSTTVNATIQTMEQTNRYLDLLLWNIDSTSLQIVESKAFTNLFDNAGTGGGNKTDEIENMLNDIKRSSTFISDILVMTAPGRVISTGGYPAEGFDMESIKKSGFYKKAERVNGGIVWLGAHPELDKYGSARENQYSMFAARLVRNGIAGEAESLVVIDVKMQFIKSLLESIKLGNGGEIHLISPDDRDVNVVSGAAKTASESVQLSKMPFFKKIRNSTMLSGSDYIKYSNNNYLMTYSRLGTTGYTLIGLLPDSTLYSASRSIAATTVLLAVFAALVAVALGLFITFSMGRILSMVTESANRAAKGDLTVEICSARKDEFGILAHSISKMISDMRQLIGEAAGFTHKVVASAGVVSDTSSHVSHVSDDISDVVRQIADGANTQSSESEDATRKIHELSSKMKAVSECTGKIGELSNQSLLLAENGSASIRKLWAESSTAADVTRVMIADIHMLSKYSKDIDKLVKVIGSIADQTNLLALNATIEAAHAGEAGLGFLVIADEIGKLADKSVASAHEAENIIKLVSGKIADTSKNASSAESVLKVQNEALSDTISAFDSVSAAMNIFNEEVNDIRVKASDMDQHKEDAIKTISEISAISQETAASTQELSASIDDQNSRISQLVNHVSELEEASGKLSEALGRFRI